MDVLLSKKKERDLNELKGSELERVVETLLTELESEVSPMTLAKYRFDVLDDLITRLEQLIFNASSSENINFHKRFNDNHLAQLNAAYCAWETILEKHFVDEVTSGKIDTFRNYRLTERFERLITREMSLLSERKVDSALFVGSGPFPISAIWMNHMLQVPIDCLDIDEMAINASKTFIKNVGFEDHLHVIHQDSPNYDVSKYDVIVIALLAKPKKDILSNIIKTMKPDCQVVCRTSHGLRKILYEPTLVNREILGNFYIKGQKVIDGDSDDTISSLLLEQRR